MKQNPYKAPDSETGPKGTKQVRGLTLASATLGAVVPPAWISALIYGWISESMLVFHVIYLLLLLGPSVGLLVFAIAGRENSVALRRPARVANTIGTFGFITIGLCGCAVYAIAVYYQGLR